MPRAAAMGRRSLAGAETSVANPAGSRLTETDSPKSGNGRELKDRKIFQIEWNRY